ncbi:imidazole glycerol phosphate synthase, glutamine amidotransferase subunit [Candidatus Falkowbacteria bacterium RIFCSPLOWO2_02_FULL_45_15]|uniref:Imidazole glycerol phosphate synthase subunit HisH n=2 Tax=Candidatus Falkowiibacteriota TaxID=1752728 RepID=A0A1F5RJP2_9BACT|nr:MAG: imidazole glycerol phosphate synthase, glutamine amidotransferase subunit [Candidatus Falkowbacteria bacterium RIFCSPHIGHO2_02_FULL_45_15]OGF19582.1 MAG: imidazole glycerol phosphate synthase, glutamine amidotransferase subunit [Candidatus Falkowbacteria bacterium RIFCSPLOWO2_02_FULL_45_15]
MRIVIIDYKMGNIASVSKAFASIGVPAVVSGEPKDIERATHLVLPGVGAFGDGMENLRKQGLIPLLRRKVLEDKTPFFGICLGMQLLAQTGTEFGEYEGLGWVRGSVIKLRGDKNLRLPHIGWNNISVNHQDVLFRNIVDDNFYFVHSYHIDCADAAVVSAMCTYGQTFAAALHQGNIFATQFHPEKSQAGGLRVLRNFLEQK